MDNPRTYGTPPYRVAVLHGGPGTPGSAAPLARALSTYCGIRAPLATVLRHFRIIVLPRCGHYPWLERHAYDRLYTILQQELP